MRIRATFDASGRRRDHMSPFLTQPDAPTFPVTLALACTLTRMLIEARAVAFVEAAMQAKAWEPALPTILGSSAPT